MQLYATDHHRSKKALPLALRNTMEKILRDILKGDKFENVSSTNSERMSAIKRRGSRTTESRLRAATGSAGVRGAENAPERHYRQT
jgi:hypothetical protein